MNNGHASVTIAGKDYPLTLPDFAEREDLALAWHTAAAASDGSALRRIAAAALGLCSALGKRSGAVWNGRDLMLYGGKVYSYLREAKATIPEIMEQGGHAVALCAESVFPREVEVESRAGFTVAPAAGSTS